LIFVATTDAENIFVFFDLERRLKSGCCKFPDTVIEVRGKGDDFLDAYLILLDKTIVKHEA
jgi:hypothetical protein